MYTPTSTHLICKTVAVQGTKPQCNMTVLQLVRQMSAGNHSNNNTHHVAVAARSCHKGAACICVMNIIT